MNENSWISAVDTLAKLHKVDYKAVGLEGYGKPTGFYRRQIGSLSKVSAAQAAAKDKDGVAVGAIEGMEELTAWFKNHEVPDSTSIVHGDYKVNHPKGISPFPCRKEDLCPLVFKISCSLPYFSAIHIF